MNHAPVRRSGTRCAATPFLDPLRGQSGAFDLPSIIVAVVVVGVLIAGVLAAVFGVIPFAQDNGAKQDLSSVRTAEGVAKAKDGRFMDGSALEGIGYLKPGPHVAVGVDAPGSCYVAVARSGTGTVYYNTDSHPDPQVFAAGTDTGCLTGAQVSALVGGVDGAQAQAPVAQPASFVQAAGTGYNEDGELGSGTVADTSVPVQAANTGPLAGKAITSISASTSHACAVADGAAYCWGYNYYGQLGNGANGPTADSYTPVAVDTTGVLAGKKVTSVSVGSINSCAVADGAAYCWGYNADGELGNGTTTDSPTPVAVSTAGVLGGKTITTISYGSCTTVDGVAYCWGNNTDGQVGDGTQANAPIPVAVDTAGALAGKKVTSVSRSFDHTCAVADGAAYCWGRNDWGQLGNGTTAMNSLTPVAADTTGVLAGKTVTSVSTGQAYTCAIASGAVYCWGANDQGQLGNGSTVAASTPAAVSGGLAGKTVSAVSADDGTNVCAIADGVAFCWGSNDIGQLGNGTTANSSTAVAADTTGVLAGKTVTAVSPGGWSTFFLYQ